MNDGVKLRGIFEWEIWSAWNEDGSRHRNARGRFERFLKYRDRFHNIITNQGLNAFLNIMLNGATQITTWYCLPVETNTSPAAGMTYATPTYTECTAYDEATRPEYVEAASSAQSTTNSASKAVFTFNATKTIYGAALVGGGTDPTVKGNTAGGGTLLCYALASPSRAVISGDVINLTYTITAADDGV